MPTYFATGVTASLRTCDLKSSLTRVVDWTQRRDHKADVERVQGLFANARTLPEKPVGEDGTENGVVRFVGAGKDMALYVVEAGEGVGTRGGDPISQSLFTNVEMKDDARYRRTLPSFTDDSPLTSLAETPTQQSFEQSPKASRPTQDKVFPSLIADVENSLENVLRSATNVNNTDPQALILDIEVCHKSFLPSTPRKKQHDSASAGPSIVGKDLKLEVFVNGQLADVSLINARKSAVQIVEEKVVRFTGMRVHRQVEKPWVYAPLCLHSTLGNNEDDAEQRWKAVGARLTHEATIRGRDRLGYLPPSADFLTALAGLDLPQRLRDKIGIGVIDVVFTAGSGKKYGPETAYLTGPTRLDDHSYSTSNSAIDPALLSQRPMFSYSPVTGASPLEQDSSPDVPLMRRRRELLATPTPNKTVDLTAEHLGLSAEDLRVQVGAYENAHGKAGKGVRTLSQRLGDLKKMNEQNQAKELAKLREEVSMKGIGPIKRARSAFELDSLDDAAVGDVDASDVTKSPDMIGNQSMPEEASPDAVLTQNRIDLALAEGAASNGYLLRRIASSSPQRTPKRKTQASALAGSPISVPIKSPAPRQPPPVTPQKRRKTNASVDSSPLRFSTTPRGGTTPASSQRVPDATSARSGSTGRGANRTARSWNPTEQSASEALKAFEVPDGCKRSCVSYAEGEDVKRQIGKARGGEFHEECMLVGMRFVVV